MGMTLLIEETLVKSGNKWSVSGYGYLVKIIKNCKQLRIAICSNKLMVTRTGIENLGALFVTYRDMQKSPKIRHFRTIRKNSFTLFFAKFLHP